MDNSELFARAIHLKEIGNLSAAKNILRSMENESSEAPAYWATVGKVLWDLGELAEAIAAFRRAIQLVPASETLSLGLFHCLWQLNEKVEALEEAQRFLQIGHSDDYEAIIREINSGQQETN